MDPDTAAPVFMAAPLTALDRWIDYPSLLIAGINVVVNAYACFASVGDFKRLHLNFLLLRYGILLSFILIGIGHFVVVFMFLAEDSTAPVHLGSVIRITLTGSECLRVLFVFIVIERTIATVYSHIYEKMSNKLVTLVLVATPMALGVYVAHFKVQNPEMNTLYYYFGFFFDLVGCLLLYSLQLYNRRLRRLNTKSIVVLSQRFQISENVAILRAIFPVVAMGVLASAVGSLLYICSFTFEALLPYFRYSTVFYFMCFNVYCILCPVVYSRSDRRRCSRLSVLCRQTRVSHLASSHSTELNEVSVRNVDGVDVARRLTTDEYFDALHKQWDVSLS